MSASSFSSFPPSFNSFPDTVPDSNARPRDRKERKHKSHGRKDHDRGSRKYDRVEDVIRADEAALGESSRLYYSDRRGDPMNVEYGRPDRGQVPKYTVVNYGRSILGLSPIYKSFTRTSQGIEVGTHRRQMPALTDAKSRHLLHAAPSRKIIGKANSDKYPEIDGFLRLPSRQRHKTQLYDAYEGLSNVYRSNSDSDSTESESEESISDSSGDEHEAAPLASHQTALKSLEQRLSEDASSIPDWLNLLSHTLSTVDVHSKNSRRARSEISISVLERAFAAHPRNLFSKELRLKYLRAGLEVWSREKLDDEWENVLKLGDVDIWMEWLEWQVAVAHGGLHEVIDAAKRILASLAGSEESEVGKVRVFWRVAICCQQAGYYERATAMFQAQAEVTFEIPQALYGSPFEDLLDAFEEYWDCECPRMGEPESKGWAHWYANKQKQGHTATQPVSSPITRPLELDPYRQWAFHELDVDRIRRIPSRSMDEESLSSEVDPYATVLFADIQPLLMNLQTPRAKNVFRLAWLSMLGLHIPGFSCSSIENWDDRWSFTHLTTPAFLNTLFPDNGRIVPVADAFAGVLIGRQKVYANSFGPMRHWGWEVLDPLDPLFGPAGMWGAVDVADVDVSFVKKVFSQLRLGEGDAGWDILALTFEVAVGMKSALKLSRSFLAEARNSPPHWAAHAHLERMRGKLNDARKIYQTVLITSGSAMSRSSQSQLWRDWAQMEWLAGELEGTLSVILRASNVEGRGGVAILRAKRTLIDLVAGSKEWQETTAWTELGVLLELTTTNDIESALAIFDGQLATTDEGTAAHENLTLKSLLFLYRHGLLLKNPIPPSILRDRATRAMERYPSNSVVVGLFLETEKGHGIWGRVRNMLGEKEDDTKDIARRIEELWISRWESGRWAEEIERTRGRLTAALDSERTRGSPILWRIYIEFEIRAKQLERGKKLLFRAIGDCPLVKELYLLAFGPLRSVFGAQELNSIAELMAERGIRMRKDLDEMLEGWQSVELEKNEKEDNNEDEIEYNARELRRLKPY